MIFHVAEEIIFLWSAFSPFLFSTCKWCSKQQPCHISVTINPTDMADNAKSPSTQWGNMTSSKNAPPFHCHSHVSEFTRGYFHPWILLSHTKTVKHQKKRQTHTGPLKPACGSLTGGSWMQISGKFFFSVAPRTDPWDLVIFTYGSSWNSMGFCSR